MTAPELLADLTRTGARSRMVGAGAVRLHVLSYPGSEPPVLVLPGITSPAMTWDFVARALAGRAQVTVLDLRGRGLSTRPDDGAYSLADLAGDVAAVVERLRLDRPILLGHSLGARVAAACAAMRPMLARELILVDPPMSGPGRDPYPTPTAAFLEQLHEAQAGTTADAVRRHYPRWPRRELELRGRWLATCDEDAVIASSLGFETDDFFPLWRDLPTPLTLVHGANSPVVTRSGAAQARADRPDAEVVAVPAAGHMIPWDNLDGFTSTVLSLLRSPHP